MPDISQNPAISQFVNTSFSQAAQDGKITGREARELGEAIDQMQLSDADKNALKEMVNQLNDSSNQKFLFFNFKKNISETDLAKLQQLAGNNPLASQLLGKFQEMEQASSNVCRPDDDSTVRSTPQEAGFDPNQNPFCQNPSTAQTSATNPVTPGGNSVTRPDWYLNQYDTGLASKSGDCGPTSAAMVARSFGLMDPNLSGADAVQAARDASGFVGSGPPWAISEDQVTRSIETLSGGQLQETSRTEYQSGQSAALIATIQEQLARGERPVLLSGTTSDDPEYAGNRHYVVITGITPEGNLLIADPALQLDPNNPAHHPPPAQMYTPQELEELLQRADNSGKGGTVLMSYGRVSA